MGRRDPGLAPAPVPLAPPPRSDHRLPGWARELAVGFTVIAAVVVVRFGAAHVPGVNAPESTTDVYASAQLRDLRQALELYARERGSFPRRLEDMVEDRCLVESQLRVLGHAVRYRATDGGRAFELDVEADR